MFFHCLNWPILRASPPGGALALGPRLYADTRRKWQSPVFPYHQSAPTPSFCEGPKNKKEKKKTHLLSFGLAFPSIATRERLPVRRLVVQETLPGTTRVPALGISRILFLEEERFPPRGRAVPLRLREGAQQRGGDGDGGHASELLGFEDGEQAGGFDSRLVSVALVVLLGFEREGQVRAAVVVSVVRESVSEN